MKLGIMQPYTFPYIGYFQLINYVDKWVVFDNTQYISKGWINRNRILHPELKKEWQYFTIPLKKHSREIKILNLEINNDINWKGEIIGKLGSYKRKAPFYSDTMSFVNECLALDSSNASKWIVNTLKKTCEYLNIPFEFSLFSNMQFDDSTITHPGQWALEISDVMGASEYVNPHAGAEIFNTDEFNKRNIKLRYIKSALNPYVQRRGGFVPGLSIIDVMMWNDVNTIQGMLSEFEIVSA